MNSSLQKPAYKRHRKLYYNTETKEWITVESMESISNVKKPNITTGWFVVATVLNDASYRLVTPLHLSVAAIGVKFKLYFVWEN